MTDNELLLTMSDLLDKKLKPVNDRLKNIELTQENEIMPRLKNIELTQENEIMPRLKKMELTQENDIMPRLQNIESCYISTFKRYQTGVEQIEAMQADVEVMKSVICEHSEKLQRLA